jgi:hypothetical protein
MVEDNLIKLQVEKEVTSLFKEGLAIIERLKLDEEKHSEARKMLLDKGNDTIRNILQFLSYFDFQISPERVNEAAKKQQIVFKKTYISQPIIV